tara:strand:+ start:1225 stop:1479 length:255 start_codon:yes stop_codon:yes gene_type:complete
MKNYLNTLLSEKGISQETVLEVKSSEWGTNFIPIASIVEFINNLNPSLQAIIKKKLVDTDFNNGNIIDCLEYIAVGMTMELTQE